MTSFWQRPTWRVFLIVFAIGLAWAIATDLAWEDFYITYRASKNLAQGKGLVFTEGEHVHSFTSPLGVLLPAVSYLLTARQSDDAALWIFRLTSLAALAGAAVLLWRIMRRLYPATVLPAAALVALVATESKTLAFTISGMETGFVLLFLAWTLWAIFLQPPRTWLHLGLAWGGLMWTRPDSCVYIAALGFGLLLFAPASEGSFWARRAQWLRIVLVAAGLCAILYLPWFLWAWSYYGSPVPHTIRAKGLFTDLSAHRLVTELWHFPRTIAEGKSTFTATYMPAYGMHLPWPIPSTISFIVSLLGCVALVVPWAGSRIRLASFVFIVGQYYLTVVAGWTPWYIPQVAMLGFLVITLALGEALQRSEQLRARWSGAATAIKTVVLVLVTVLVLDSVTLAVVMGRQARLAMSIAERSNRAMLGRWLHDHAKSDRETVFLEPLGFIGFYSGLKMLDYPGLCAPEVVAARRRATSNAYPFSWSELIRMLQPDWLVLRPFERESIEKRDYRLLETYYERAIVFDATPRIREARFVPIPGFLEYDAVFEVYRRKNPPLFRSPTFVPLHFDVTLEQMTRKDALYPVEAAGLGFKAHAPSTIVVPVPEKCSLLSGGYGIYEGAYANPRPGATDGVEFAIVHVGTDGKRTELLRRYLNPSDVVADRGLQTFNLELPSSTGVIEWTTAVGPRGESGFDWAYWQALQFGAFPTAKD
ncbi:MAG TPA: hypothetical protein VFJ90_06385 [Candidatus Didemnitutus sp.]|nr:hypothetical protein [Candidatus Didemnitutus sp.]